MALSRTSCLTYSGSLVWWSVWCSHTREHRRGKGNSKDLAVLRWVGKSAYSNNQEAKRRKRRLLLSCAQRGKGNWDWGAIRSSDWEMVRVLINTSLVYCEKGAHFRHWNRVGWWRCLLKSVDHSKSLAMKRREIEQWFEGELEYEYRHPSLSAGDWFQNLLLIPKSLDSQVPWLACHMSSFSIQVTSPSKDPTNPRLCNTVLFKNNSHICGPTQLKLGLFKGQLIRKFYQ